MNTDEHGFSILSDPWVSVSIRDDLLRVHP